MAGTGPKPRVVLVHGEQRQRLALAAKVRERFGVEAGMPERLAVVEV
jgi:predicted metal-dependent RNase